MPRKKRDPEDDLRISLEDYSVAEANRAIEHINRCYNSPMHSRREAAAAFRRAADAAKLAARLAGEPVEKE